MGSNNATSIKIGFVQKIGKGEFETETICCQGDGENFVVDNIPFITKRISLGDTIKDEYDTEDEMYYFENFVKTSGNSTIIIFFNDYKFVESAREWLNKNNCESEGFLKRNIIAVNIPKEVDYKPALNQGQGIANGFLDARNHNGF